MKTTILSLMLVQLLAVAPPAFAQTDCSPNCVLNPSDGSDGTGGFGTCYECVPHRNADGSEGPNMDCEEEISASPPNFPYMSIGYQSCTAHNTTTAHYCAMGPHNCYYTISTRLTPSYALMAAQMEEFLRAYPGVPGRDVDALLERAGRNVESRYYVLLGEAARRTGLSVFDGEVFTFGTRTTPKRHRPVIVAAVAIR